MTERDRLEFIRARDGEQAMLTFASITLAKYTECMDQDGKAGRKFHHSSLPHYRPLFAASCAEFQRVLK